MRGLAKTSRSAGSMELVDVETPEPAADEALIEVEYAGLCGSDAGIYAFKSSFERMELPTIIGHEYTGRIVEVGDDVTKFSVGDRVVERPIRSCGDCYQCEVGQANVCPNKEITGVDHDGAYAGYIAVPEEDLHPVPDDVEPRHAALVEPTAITTRAVIRNSRVKPGDRVFVAGPGPMGILAAQVANAQGADVVVAGVGRDTAYRLPLAAELGFETINVEDDDLKAYREDLTDGVGYDVVFDTTGHPSGLTMAVDEVRKGGQIVLVGQTGETTMEFTPLVRSEIDLQCTYSAMYEDFERALRLIGSGDVDHATFLDDRFSLLEADEAFETFLEGETCKPVFDVSVLRA
ncbi:alcohol dehydrogenase catalytic domain-containing protein [Haloterrigena sp. SYSU A558-1]|uniref:Alcohol dehydrogenase catalytic domain-containing protein n=1 Tax=Haloterrigena gelatinilytica TaxID=2741724 RepID=A0A8J8GJY1_9EURY|nr:alcohol dehydrogenase catalytic domain-containing protein [Haloterrigena gelatinilytica]NUB90961.1 alcohol dehydrogenase catalytic domain-containing protein [Haloterrigena gelatinilytica]NUC73222.1 alcohol dehydrogenase catalytic domain-containing protein [Haloterrigena gelatinilytica]